MAVQIYPERGMASSLAGALGKGIGTGLEMLAQNRLQGLLQQQQQAQMIPGLQALGIAPDQAQQLSTLPIPLLQDYVKQQKQLESQRAIANLLGLAPQQQQVSPEQLTSTALSDFVASGLGGSPGGLPQLLGQQPQQVPAYVPSAQLQAQLVASGVDPKIASDITKAQAAQEKSEMQLSKEAREFSAPYIQKAAAAEKNIRDYKLLSKLAKSGKLRAGTSRRILSLFGLDQWNENAATQIAAKLIGRLKQNVGPAFGGNIRLTNFLEQVFQESIPGLWNTPEGIALLSDMNAKIDELGIVENNARRNILAKTGGRVPYDIDDQIRDRIKPVQDRIEKEVEDIALRSMNGRKKKAPTEIAQGEGTPATYDQEYEMPEEESIPGLIGRTAARLGSRAIEAAAGVPGDLAQIVADASRFVTGGRAPTYEEIQKAVPFPLPTSEQIKKFGKKFTGEYLEPRGGIEEIADEVVGDLAAMAFPFLKTKLPFKNLMLKLGGTALRSLGGTVAAKGVESLGGGPVAQGVTKFLFMTAPFGVGGRRALEQKAKDAYEEAAKFAPKRKVNVTKFQKELNKFADSAQFRASPDKKFLTERLKTIEEAISDGKASIEDLWETKKALNSYIGQMGTKTPPLLKKIVGMIKEPLENAASKYKKFGKPYEMAEDIYKGLHNYNEVTNFIKSIKSYAIKHPLIKMVLYGTSPLTAIPAATLAIGANEGVKFVNLLAKSKEARKYYWDLLKYASKQNAKATARTLNKLDDWAYEEFPVD